MANTLVLKANGKSLSHSPQSGHQLYHQYVDVYVYCRVTNISCKIV